MQNEYTDLAQYQINGYEPDAVFSLKLRIILLKCPINRKTYKIFAQIFHP